MVNLSAFIRFHATATPDRIALTYDGMEVTYGDFWTRIRKAAAILAERGIGPDDVVAAFMKNSAAFLELAFAVSHLGAVFLPVNYRLAAEEAAYILGNADAKLLFADAEFAEMFAARNDIITVDDDAQHELARLGAPDKLPEIAVRQPGDLMRLMYTSGTTSHPKGVLHSYSNFYWKNMDHVMSLGLTRDDRLLVVGPLYHVGAFDLPGVAVLWLGGRLCVLRDFDPVDVLAAIQREKLTCAWMAPVMSSQILSHPDRDKYDVTSLRWTIGGGEKTPESRIRAFGEFFTNARYIDGYGLTESCSGDTLMEAGMEIEKIGSTGRALAHVEVQIRDDDGNVLPPDSEGEICLRGPKITKGYWKDPEKTKASFFGDWFRTGDMGVLDADGFLYITDRKKDMIISGGENIASSEVERVIYRLDGVADAAVIGLPDERWGERPVAVVVMEPGKTLDYATLEAHCRAHLAGFKVPKALFLRDELPRNPSGKILKRVLRDDFAG